MAREIAYQSVGNPIQYSRLPRRRPDLAMSYLPYAQTDDSRYASELLRSAIGVSLAALLIRFLAVFSPGLLGWLVANLIPAAMALYLLARARQEFNTRLLRIPLGCLALATLYLNVPAPAFVHLIVASLAVGVLTWLFARHWTAFCTTSPLDQRTARQLQRSWQGYIAGVAALPAVLVIVSFFLPAVALAIAAAVVLFQVVEALCTRPSARSVTVAWRAIVSWLTYDRHDARPPGAFRSPAGVWPARLAATGLCIVALAVLPIDSLQASRVATDSAGDVSLFGSLRPAIWQLLLWLPCVLMLPALLAVMAPALLSLPLLAEAERRRSPQVTAGNWQRLVDDIQTSQDPIERDSVYMGRLAHDETPLIVPRKVYGEHAHFLGDTGGGKTSLGLCPLMEQLGIDGKCSMIVVDLKADRDSMELLGTLQATAKKARQRTGCTIPLKHFTNQIGHSTFAFNLLRYPYWRNLELYMRTDILCGALGLSYGSDYGEGYYSSANAAVLHHTIKLYPDIRTYRELGERVGYVVANAKKDELHPEIRKAGVHVKTVLDRLGSFAALNAGPENGDFDEVLRHAIDFTQVFREPQFHYFHLSSTLAPGASPEIGRLVAYSLLAAATQVERCCPVYLVIDEFQRMVARNLEYLLQLARSMGVGVILANQTMQDLRTSTADLIPTIEANCRYRQWFAVSAAEDRQRLIDASGETVDHLITETTYFSNPNEIGSIASSEHINHRLTVNDVLLASDHPRQSIVRISRGEGYAQYGGMPFLVESDFHISKWGYENRKHTAWPEGVTGSFIPPLAGPSANPPQPPRPAPGPVVVTEVIGQSPPAPDATPDPLAQFVPQSKSRRKKR